MSEDTNSDSELEYDFEEDLDELDEDEDISDEQRKVSPYGGIALPCQGQV